MDNRWLIVAPGLATAISLVLGLWLGYILQGRPLPAVFAAAPLLLPPTLIGAWFLLPWFTLPVAVLAASAFGVPFLLLSSRIAFGRLDPGFLNTARSLGASEWRVFWRIALPLAWRPILAAAAILFVRVATELALLFGINRQ
jgi:molybdate transport system permease protein